MAEPAREYALEQLEALAPADLEEPAAQLARAVTEADAIRERARAEGFEQGYAAGHAEAVEGVRTAAPAIAEAAAALARASEEAAGTLERDAVELAFALSRKVLAGALEAQPERVLDVVRGALRHIADRRTITILVNPHDMEIVSSAVDELRAKDGGIEQCEVHADRRVGAGGAIVRTSEGEVDAGVETQLERAREIVAEELGAAAKA